MTLIYILLIVGAYCLGSLSSAIILCRLYGLPDPRSQGSGNPGATNVLRFGGRKLAAMVLLGDMLKGLLPVVLSSMLTQQTAVLASVALAAFLGHIFPVFFAFRGGKGVATALGVIFGLSWPSALILLAIWLLVSAIFRLSSLSALCAALSAPFIIHLFTATPVYTLVISVISIILLWRHQSNIRNLLAGTEPHIGRKSR